MQTDPGSVRVPPGLAEVLVVLGGVAAVAGSFLDWFRVHLSVKGLGLVARTVTSRGIDGSDGKITLIAGALTAAMGLSMFVWTSGGRRMALGVVALLGGLAAAGLSGYDAGTPQQRFIDANAPNLARKANISLAMAERLYRGLFDSGAVKISLALGIFVVIAGGVVAALSAAMALGKSPVEPDTASVVKPVATTPEASPE
jgi:hypothetical protein